MRVDTMGHSFGISNLVIPTNGEQGECGRDSGGASPNLLYTAGALHYLLSHAWAPFGEKN